MAVPQLIPFLLVAAVVVWLAVLLLIRRKPAAPDPRIAIFAKYEAGLMAS
ncbi:MAG TPA: hypothetical protein VJV97_04525 [Gemmatimonadaceae bacterium]|nr:hypothetical protein [Gemmatimonadaceae bacterium]